MPCVHTDHFCTQAVRVKKCSNRQQQKRFSYLMTGRRWLNLRFHWWECTSSGWRIQSLGHHRSSYKQKIIWQRVTRADARHGIICPTYHGTGRQLVSDQEKILRKIRRSLRAGVCPFAPQMHTFRGKVLRSLQSEGLNPYHCQSVQTLQNQSAAGRIPVTGLGTVTTCETWCVLWVVRVYVTWDNKCYNTRVRIPTILTITLWWSRDARKINSNLKQFLRNTHTGKM